MDEYNSISFDATEHTGLPVGHQKTTEYLVCEICHREVDSCDIRWHQTCPDCKQKALKGQKIAASPRIDRCALCGAEEDIRVVNYGICGLEVECRNEDECLNRQAALGRAHHCMLCKGVYHDNASGGTWLQRCKNCQINLEASKHTFILSKEVREDKSRTKMRRK